MTDAHENHDSALPEVHDEAGNTPMWVPILGLVLLALLGLMSVLHPTEQVITVQEVAAPADAPTDAPTDAPVPTAPAANE